MKKFIFIITLILIIIFFGRNLNPFSGNMFTFHDETQPARIQEFVLNLKTLHIPPRIAPDFSFKMGYPVFNFYAPASYWITGIISVIGIHTLASLKISFLLTIIVGFIASYFFLREYFDFFPSVTGAFLYISSVYYPLNIFVRGNLGEVWFLALFPVGLVLVKKTAKKPVQSTYFFTVIALLLLFTVHNLLSVVGIVLVVIFALILPHKKTTLSAIVLGLLISSYFIVPLLMENHLTYATAIATQTKYTDHFLCPNQLWDSPWGYGGSIPGCNDGMSFKIGKLQLIFAALGMLIFFWNTIRRKKASFNLHSVFFITLSAGSLFMTTYQSKFIWDLFSPLFALFQFPWRFIAFSLLGLSYFAAYFFQNLHFRFKNLVLLFIIGLLFVIQSKYFAGKTLPIDIYKQRFLSQDYIENKAAYQIPEYFPRTKKDNVWRTYQETPVEKFADYITLFSFAVLIYIVKGKKLWNRLKT